jgi:hypothetical protein
VARTSRTVRLFRGRLGGVIEQARALRAKRVSRVRWWAWVSLGGIAGCHRRHGVRAHHSRLRPGLRRGEQRDLHAAALFDHGLWSALEGSLMLWVLLQCAITFGVVTYYRRDRADAVVGWAAIVLFCIGAFFTFLMMGPADPFIHNAAHVLQGAGPNALLQDNPLVAVHPPLLYLGFVGFSVPFAFAIAMLITGRVQERWPLEQRRWTVLAWGSLSLGIVLGRGGATRYSGGADSGGGTPSRTRRCCPGSRRPRIFTRSSSRTDAGSFGSGTSRSRSPPSPSPSSGRSSRARACW